jgi:trypsin
VALLLDGELLCGGTIVSADVVLTAAHCTDGQEPGSLQVLAGTIDLRAGDGQRRGVARVVQHEAWDPVFTRNDMALLFLDGPLAFDAAVAPVPLPTEQTAQRLSLGDAPAVVTGFGAVGTFDSLSPVLLEADVTVLGDGTCAGRYAGDGAGVYVSTQLCAGVVAGGVDACFGDSGGPLVAPIDEQRTAWSLVGVVSWGAGCGQAFRPTVYSEVGAFLGWLAQHGVLGAAGTRFDAAGGGLRLPAFGSRGKATRYPSTVEVAGAGPVAGIAVELRGLGHEHPSDLVVRLQGPGGQVVALLAGAGGARRSDPSTVLVTPDGARPGDVPLPLRVAPSEPLDPFLGTDPNGEWRLWVVDTADDASGLLEGWTLVLR